jgi:restriction system protein
MAQQQRERERAVRAQEQAQRRAFREAERTRNAYERARNVEEKQRKRLYLESRVAEVDAMNAEIERVANDLANLLAATLDVDDHLDFDSLKSEPELPVFQPGNLARPEPEINQADFLVPPLSGIKGLLPGAKAKHAIAVEEGAKRYQEGVRTREDRERDREARLQAASSAHEAEVSQVIARTASLNAEVDQFRARFDALEPDAIVEYFSLVLDSSSYPAGFPQHHRIAYVPESKQLVVEYELPTVDIVPTVKQHRYVKARDAVEDSPRPVTQIRSLYSQVIAQTTLRTIHELFEADRGGLIDSVVFNGYVSTIDPSNGQAIKPHLVTLRTIREVFTALQLASGEPLACLKGLNASVSKSPTELTPVRPVLEFSMVDPRFVQESDVLGTMDTRPNLMELSPSEFESLITNLFEKMGLETRQTQASRDGGVDCVAWDKRPIFGGKVVIQAKRYKNTVGVSAVRDLYGTTQNEGASKGILVTTSGYGNASFQFAENKPLELLSGSHLLFLLAEHTGIEARIEPPEDWIDPLGDVDLNEPPVAGPNPAPAQSEPPAADAVSA